MRCEPSAGTARRATCAVMSLASNRLSALVSALLSALGAEAPKIAAPCGLAQRIRVPSSVHAQAGNDASASGAREGSRSQIKHETASLIRPPSKPPLGNHGFVCDVSSAVDLRFLQQLRRAWLRTSNRKAALNHKLAGAPLRPKLVPTRCIMNFGSG